jgi:hypothetical protein
MTAAPIPISNPLEIKFARALTDAVAPEESPFFDDLLASIRNPPSKRKDHTLGFGVSAGDIAAVALVLIDLAKPILSFIWENAKDATGALIKDASEHAKTVIEEKMSTWLDHKLKGAPPLALSPGKLEELIEKVEKDAAALKLDASATTRLCDTLRSAFIEQ